MEVNVVAMADLRYQFKERLTESKGAIINLSSVGGHVGMAGFPGYCASKHAILGLTKSLADRWTRHGIRVNSIAPDFIETRGIDWARSNPPISWTEQQRDAWTLSRCCHLSLQNTRYMEKRPQRQGHMLRPPIGPFDVSVVWLRNHRAARPRKTAHHTAGRERHENHSISRDCVVTLAVLTEPVSATDFPVLREFTGKYRDFATF